MWLPYNDKYDVSSDGEVRHRRLNKIVLGVTRKTDSYTYIGENIGNNQNKNHYIHRMVAERFCPKVDQPGLTVDHINRDRSDNRACNLRWCDKSLQSRNKSLTSQSIYGKCIRLYPSGNFNVQIKHRTKTVFNKTFKTLAEAITARDKFILTL
jgi:hypothetical protein